MSSKNKMYAVEMLGHKKKSIRWTPVSCCLKASQARNELTEWETSNPDDSFRISRYTFDSVLSNFQMNYGRDSAFLAEAERKQQ